MLLLKLTNFLKPSATYQKGANRRQLWGYVALAFNNVDADRLKQVGPDRLCAEWVMKNGGAVQFLQIPGRFLRDYNSLPPDNVKLQVKEIDATDASIMKVGMEHLIGCRCIDRIVLHNCKHLEEDGLEGLAHVKDTLEQLQVSGCYNISDAGLLAALKQLTNLKSLTMFDLRYVKDVQRVTEELQKCLPKCSFDVKP